MPRVLTFADWYLPGYKAGGPIRSISNLVAMLGNEFEFSVLTRDRDLMDSKPYDKIKVDEWVEGPQGKVLYTNNFSLRNLRKHISAAAPDAIYLNSFFSRISMKVLALRRFGLIARIPVVI